MTLEVNAPGSISEGLNSLIEEKSNRLQKFYDKISEVNVYFKKDDAQTEGDVTAEIRVMIPGHDAYADAHGHNYERAFRDAYYKVERQLRKKNEQLKAHH